MGPKEKTDSRKYRKNHYVPVWYQKKFLVQGQKNQEIFLLNLRPESFVDPRGVSHRKNPVRHTGVKQCFFEEDLYTSVLGSIESTEIEESFFGTIDSRGHRAVNYFEKFNHPSAEGEALRDMLMYLSTQKLRTPKGLAWLSEQAGAVNKEEILRLMIRFRQLHSAIWAECIWLIADASRSDTKFIVSDHPITVYNRRCGPRSQWCRGVNDPDIRFHGTHTLFPLSLNKILILTNLSWIRNPYQSEVKLRPNPNPFRDAIFNFTDIQTSRYLTEQEVQEVNFIIKTRALRFIASAKEEWLYPEKFISKSNWNSYGNGYLFMPDPRAVNYGGEIMWGNFDGTGGAVDAYGRKPWDSEYGKEGNDNDEFATFHRFQGEFARLFGPTRRGLSFQTVELDKEVDSGEFHQYHLSLEKTYQRKRSRKKMVAK